MVDDLSSHYKICKSKNSEKSLKQKKDVLDSVILNEMLTNQSIEESTIGDNQKQILKHEITSPLHPSVIDRNNFPSEEIYYFSTEFTNKNIKNNEESKILSIKKNLFTKFFPLKEKKGKKLIRIQKKKNKKSKIKKKKEENSRSFINSQKNNISYFENSPLLSNTVDNITY